MDTKRTLQRPVTESTSILSLLPVEIVREILEVSARDSGQTAARLVQVSSLVRCWILPILYETIIIENARQCIQIWGNFLRDEARPDAVPLSSLVRNIGLHASRTLETREWLFGVFNDAGIPMSLAEEVTVTSLLHSFTNARNMYINTALACFDLSSPGHHPLAQLTQLHCGSWDSWLGFSSNLDTFPALTHLRVDIIYNTGLSRSWTALQAPSRHLPNLTHLAFGMDSRCKAPELRATAVFVRDILARPGMVMVIVTAWFSWSKKRVVEVFSGLDDPRLFIIHDPGAPNEQSSVVEWEAQARGQKCMWEVPLRSS
ncbi:hypothetical protein BU17DRAFT_97599 [Hysterangium stoloniferum]|nr:hypothetical protein BU17DRAFT_97599 [Hysterangium stoloniferum]